MRVFSALPQQDLTEVPAAARAAEEAGYAHRTSWAC
jgi:hypothetical protein